MNIPDDIPEELRPIIKTVKVTTMLRQMADFMDKLETGWKPKGAPDPSMEHLIVVGTSKGVMKYDDAAGAVGDGILLLRAGLKHAGFEIRENN